jgi:hypothetical protein
MARNLPDGNRVYVKPKIGGKVRPCRMKSGTAAFLGLKPQDPEKGKGYSIKRGAMGTKSFTLLLKKKQTVGGAGVVSLDVPVPGNVKVLEFYKYAKGRNNVAGIRTPDGVSYMWADWAGSSGGGSGNGGPGIDIPGPFGDIDLEDIGDIIDGIGDVIGGDNPITEGIELGFDILFD